MNKLLVFTEVYVRGGGNRTMVDFINAIADNYEEIIVATNLGALHPEHRNRFQRPFQISYVSFLTRSLICDRLRHWPSAIRNAIAVSLVFLEPLFFLWNVSLFCILLKRLMPSRVLSCNGGYPGAAACLSMVVASGLLKIPVILSVVSVPMPRRQFLRPLLYIFDRLVDFLVGRFVKLVIVNAQAIAGPLRVRHKIPASKLAVVHNGVESAGIATPTERSNNHVVIGCIARMDIAKGVLVLLDAFIVLVRTRPELRLVLAGHGDASPELARRIKLFGLEDCVQMLGHFEGDVHALINTFDFYVFPSFWEGLPSSIIEAMRASAVIVTTNVGGIPEIITDGKEGLLVNPHSSDEIVLAITRLLEDTQLCLTLRRNAHLKYENYLTLDRMQKNVKDLFDAYQF